MTERLQEGIIRLIDHYDLPLGEVMAMLFDEDYPPLIPGDLGDYEAQLTEEMYEEF